MIKLGVLRCEIILDFLGGFPAITRNCKRRREIQRESVSGRLDVKKTQPSIGGSKGGRGPGAKGCRQSAAAGEKATQQTLPPEPPEETQPAKTLISAQTSDLQGFVGG